MKSLLEFITDRENIPKREDMPKMNKDTSKRDIINNENEVNENRVNDFKRAVSSIGFRKINVYRF